MAEKVVLNFEIKGVTQSITNFEELQKAIAATESELKGMDIGSDAFNKQKKQVDELKEKYGELSKSAAQSSKESTEKFMAAGDNFEKFAKGVVDAVAGIAIAMGASGEESDAMVKKFVQIQGVATGLKGGIEAFIVVITSAQKAFAALNIVMSANVIGLIVLGIAALATGIYFLIKNIDTVIDFFSEWQNIVLALLGPLGLIIAIFMEMNEAEEDLRTEREKASAEATAQSKKRVAELKFEHAEFKKSKEAENGVLEKRIEIQENIGGSSYALRLQLAENNAAILKDEIETTRNILLTKQEEFRVKAELAGMTKDAYAQSIGLDYGALVTQATAILDEMQLDVQVAESNVTKIKKDEQEKRADDAQASADKQNAINEKLYQDELSRIHRLQAERNKLIQDIETAENAYYDSKLTNQQREENAVYDYYYALIEGAKTLGPEYVNEVAILEEAKLAKLEEINAKYDLIEEQRIKAKREKDIADFNAWKEKEILKEQEATARKIGIAKSYSDAASALAETVFTLTNRFGKQDEEAREKRAKRQFQINKALALSAAIIDGFKAITASLAAAPLVIGVVPNPVGIANLVVTAATTAANIAKIAASQYKSSGGGGGASASVPSSSGNVSAGDTSSSITAASPSQQLFGVGNNKSNVTPFGQGTQNGQSPQPIIIQNTISAAEMTTVQSDLGGIQTMATLSVGG
jgi:hypothetical protein